MASIDEDRVRRIEQLVRRVEVISDQSDRKTAQELMEAILELHGVGIERMMEILFDAGESGKTAIRKLASDSLVSSLLVLHGLHPDDLEARVQQALGKFHGRADLLGVFEGVVRIRIFSNGVREGVEAAVRDAAPDAAEFIFEEGVPVSGFVSLESLVASRVA